MTLFDAKAAWATLSPEQQRTFGELGLLLAYIFDADGLHADYRWFDIAEATALALLQQAAVATGRTDIFMQRPARPALAPFGVAQCRNCGCTDDHACLPDELADDRHRCRWVEADLCSACVAGTPC